MILDFDPSPELLHPSNEIFDTFLTVRDSMFQSRLLGVRAQSPKSFDLGESIPEIAQLPYQL
jgi:hypothetical protein